MSKSKKTKNTEQLSPQEYRRKKWEEMQKSSKSFKEEDVRKDFRKYFIQLKRKLDLDPSLEEVMWLHFKAAGFAKTELFDQGVKHFGYKI